MQGETAEDVDRIALGKPSEARLREKEQVLLDYVRILTLEPAKVRDTDVERMRRAGWTDEQIFEASFITALFAFFNRMADAYGLDYQPDRWLPPDQRPPKAPETAHDAAGAGSTR